MYVLFKKYLSKMNGYPNVLFDILNDALTNAAWIWALACDRLVSHPGGVNSLHLLNTTKTGDKRRLHGF